MYVTNEILHFDRAFTQRHQMKRRNDGKSNLLTEERIKKLNDIGFVWHAKQNKEWQDADRLRKQAMVESMWQNHYQSLLAFKKKHGKHLIYCFSLIHIAHLHINLNCCSLLHTGHTRVPKVYKQNQALSTW